jgi:hypothetical protein
VFVFAVLGVGDPALPEEPAKKGETGAVAYEGNVRHALLEDGDERYNEYYDGADMLDDDGGVGDEGPKIVRL